MKGQSRSTAIRPRRWIDDRGIATHEAGHAVVAIVRERIVVKVAIDGESRLIAAVEILVPIVARL